MEYFGNTYNEVYAPTRLQTDPVGYIGLPKKEKAAPKKVKKKKKVIKEDFPQSKVVYIFDLECKYVGEFESMIKAGDYFGVCPSSISKRCRDQIKDSIKEHYFSMNRKPSWEGHPERKEKPYENLGSPVYRFDSEGRFIETYSTRKDLSRDLGISLSTIAQMVNHNNKNKTGRLSNQRNPEWELK